MLNLKNEFLQCAFLKHGDLSKNSLADFTTVPRNHTSRIWCGSDFQPVTT